MQHLLYIDAFCMYIKGGLSDCLQSTAAVDWDLKSTMLVMTARSEQKLSEWFHSSMDGEGCCVQKYPPPLESRLG